MQLKSRVILGAATATAAIGATLIPASTAVAAAPSIQVSWATQQAGPFNLQDGDIVSVTGTGFPASSTVYVSECSTLTGGAADCDQDPSDGGVAISQTDASGGFTINASSPQPFVFRTEKLGSASCTAGTTCHAVATTNPQAPDVNTNTAAADLPVDRLQVTPRTGLKTGQAVTITGGGYKPGATVYVSECTGSDPTKALQDCNTSAPGVQTYTADSNGAFGPTTYTVHTGQVNSDGSSCQAGKPCIIAGDDNILNPTNGNFGGAVVTFAALKPLSVTEKASVGHVAKGKTFKVTGKATSGGAGVAGLNAVLDKVVNGSLQKVAAAKTVSGGGVVFKVTQKKTTTYKIVIAPQKGYNGATSKGVKVSTP